MSAGMTSGNNVIVGDFGPFRPEVPNPEPRLETTQQMTRRPKRKRDIPLYVRVSLAELDQIQERMAEAGVTNREAFIRKLVLNGYVLHVDLSPVKELVSLQRRCSNNLNQIATKVNSGNQIFRQELLELQRDYAALWGPLAELLSQLAEIVRM